MSTDDVAAVTKNAGAVATLSHYCTAHQHYRPHPHEELLAAKHYGTTRPGPTTGTTVSDAPTTVDKQATDDFARDSRAAYRFAACYLADGQQRWAKAAGRILDAWSTRLTTVTGEQARDVVAFFGPYMVAAARLTDGSPSYHHEDFSHFVDEVLAPVSTGLQANNNRGLWALLLAATIADFHHDESALKDVMGRWQSAIDNQIDAHGIFPHEIVRTDTSTYTSGPRVGVKGIDYTNFALLPATLAAEIFDATGLDPYDTKQGQRLITAATVAAGWSAHPETFPYYQSNCGRLPGLASVSYLAAIAAHTNDPAIAHALANTKVTADGFLLSAMRPDAHMTDAPGRMTRTTGIGCPATSAKQQPHPTSP